MVRFRPGGCLSAVTAVSKAFALAVPHEKTIEVRDEVGFFQAVRAVIVKTTATGGRSPEELDTAVKQIVSKAVASEEVMDIFAMAGLTRPEISILSDSFLAEVRDMPQRNLALEVLKKLLADEIKARGRKNVVEAFLAEDSRRCSKRLCGSIRYAVSRRPR